MSQVLGKEISEESVHSLLMCKKCFKLFDEIDELEQRLLDIKVELVGNYKKSVQKSNSGEDNAEDEKSVMNDGSVLDQKESNKENEVPKKILDIPSSDDDTQVLAHVYCYFGDYPIGLLTSEPQTANHIYSST